MLKLNKKHSKSDHKNIVQKQKLNFEQIKNLAKQFWTHQHVLDFDARLIASLFRVKEEDVTLHQNHEKNTMAMTLPTPFATKSTSTKSFANLHPCCMPNYLAVAVWPSLLQHRTFHCPGSNNNDMDFSQVMMKLSTCGVVADKTIFCLLDCVYSTSFWADFSKTSKHSTTSSSSNPWTTTCIDAYPEREKWIDHNNDDDINDVANKFTTAFCNQIHLCWSLWLIIIQQWQCGHCCYTMKIITLHFQNLTNHG